MAVIQPTPVRHGEDGRVKIVKWLNVTENDTCAPYPLPAHPDKTMVVTGTFGGTSVAIHGCIDPAQATFVPLKDQSDNVIAITSNGTETIVNAVYAYKPVLTGGAATTITIWLMGISR